MPVRISSLHVYPVKGCRGIEVDSADVTRTGLKFDRTWMVVTADSHRFVSQRQKPRMALIEVSLPPEALSESWGPLPPDAALTLRAPGQDPLQVALDPKGPLGATLACSCWEWQGLARDEGEDAAAWLSAALGRPCRLVRYIGVPQPTEVGADATRRAVDEQYATGHETAFADGFPFTMISNPSLRELNQRMNANMRMNRFRPNITVDGCEPFAEDTWATAAVGSGSTATPPIVFDFVKPLSRCTVPTIDQETAQGGPEPTKTLQAYRSGQSLGYNQEKSFKHAVFFGYNLVARATGWLAVGDLLQVAPR
ncbi:hypothetical protein WJX72_001876 [[Myrmecia] bisecta]|uniref:MOSC domain-containing protein n=1 Tax=[Myrmecia] bisecta TaxID=41462 RepID=A0AAW1Q4S9_9CHLO